MKFCFWGDVAGALKGKTKGGGELQTALLARAMAIAGHEVVIIDPFSKESFDTDEGVKVLSVPEFNKGIKGIRLFTHRLPAMWKLFREQKADFYYIRMRSYYHILPYFAAKKSGGKLIQAIASDLDILSSGKKFRYSYKPRFNILEYLTLFVPNDLVFNFLLTKSDFILLQHPGQHINSRSGKAVVKVFANIINTNSLPPAGNEPGDYYIQVGDVSILKGVDKLYELIKDSNGRHTFMIVGLAKDRRSKAIFEKLAKMKNVVIKGRQGHAETLCLIANARALLNTSYFEGFPNIFLEAWASGVPVISLKVNPGNVFNEHCLGICCDGDIAKMKEFIESDKAIHFDKDCLVSYVRDFHDFNTAGNRFLNIINNTSN